MYRIQYTETIKPVLWHSKARETVRSFPKPARNELGYLIFRLQKGETFGMPHSRPVRSVGPGINELRVRDAAGIYRAFYYISDPFGIMVFHAFKKKTQSIPQRDIKLGKKHFKELLNAQQK